MRKTEYTDDELRDKIASLFFVAGEQSDEANAHMKKQQAEKGYGGQDAKYWALKNGANKSINAAYTLIDSGQIPWLENNGLGNNCDMSGQTTEVVARRVFDRFTNDNELSDFDGRAIELRVTRRPADGGGSEHTLTFRNPATVKAAIEQLQMELDGWDDWNGRSNDWGMNGMEPA